ncbi:MAG: hypothetical protein A2168_08240 [Planctomycetes bacterium RBG_13_50_24]|nr:MAG: hypothetical protein A2168_08240 [Planctomycetes bacterium RBG_13_50_24]
MIEILGFSDAGKATMKRMLLDRLSHHGLQARDAEISANGTSCSKLKMVLVELLRNPWLLPMAIKPASLKPCKYGPIIWLRCLIRNVYTSPLDKKCIDRIILESFNEPKKSTFMYSLLAREQIQQGGVWWTVEKGRQANLSDVVESLVERISKEVHHPSRVRSNGDKELS